MLVRSLSQEDPLEEKTATCSSILAWKTPWREGPGGLQSIGLQRVGHDWATEHIFTKQWLTLLMLRLWMRQAWSLSSWTWHSIGVTDMTITGSHHAMETMVVLTSVHYTQNLPSLIKAILIVATKDWQVLQAACSRNNRVFAQGVFEELGVSRI